MSRVSLAMLLIAWLNTLPGQNLLINSNFEELSSCPTGLADFNALNWYVPTGGTTDYLHDCGANSVSVPSNFVGFQESSTGDAYAGLITYYKGLQNYREYIQAELITPTVKGGCYQLTIVYSSADLKGDSDGLGMLLSEGVPTMLLEQTAQLQKFNVEESKTIWNTLTMEYVSPGGETHVTIGNFNNDSKTTFIMPPDGPTQDFVYYYIDSIGVVDISSPSENIVVDLGEDLIVCNNDFPITLTSNLPNECNVWSTGEVANSIEIQDFGEYYLRVNINCEYGIDTIRVTEIAEPVLQLEDVVVCEGENYIIDLDETLGDYQWQDGYSGSEYSISSPGNYSITLSYECGDVFGEFDVTQIQKIEIPEMDDLELCVGELPFDLDLSEWENEGNIFMWSDGSNSSTIAIEDMGNYSVTISNDCFVDSLSLQANVSFDFPTVIDFTDTIACLWEDKIINLGFDNADFEWEDGFTEPYNIVSGPGTYYVTVSNFCRTQVFEFEIDEAIESDFDLGPDITLCAGDSVLISYTENVSWSTGQVNQEIWMKEAGQLIGVVAGKCSALSDTIMITIEGVGPELYLSDSLLLCAGDTIAISATDSIAGIDFEWNTGADSAEIEVFNEGIYIVTAENNCGSVTDSVHVILGEALPDPALLDQYLICKSDSLVLSIDKNNSIVQWSTGELDTSITIFEQGNYFVSVSNSCKTKTDSFSVEFLDELVNFNLGGDFGICEDQEAIIKYQDIDGSYIWNTGSNSDSISVSMAGEYWLEITGECNVVSDTIEVFDLGTVPEINLGLDLSFCAGDTLELSVGSADVDEVIWNTSSNDFSISVFEAGSYIVQGTNACGADSDTILLTFNDEVPMLDLGQDQSICPGDSLFLDSGISTGQISWNTGDEGSSIYVQEEGLFVATLNSSCGVSTDSIYVVIEAAAPTLELGEDVSLCAGEVLEYDLVIDDDTAILWNNGDADAMTSFSESGIIWLELSNFCGVYRDSVELSFIPALETFSLPEDVILCDKDSYTIVSDVTQSNVEFEWNTSEEESFIEATSSGWYWLEITNDCFELRDSIRIDFLGIATEFDLGMNDTICAGQSLILSADLGDAFEYKWQDNSTETDFIVTENGTYSLEISNECGTQSDEVVILVLETDEIDVPIEDLYVLCKSDPLVLDLNNLIIDRVIWNDGSTELERILNEPGQFFVQLINNCSDTIFHFEIDYKNCLGEKIYLPNSFSPNDDNVNDVFSIQFPDEWLFPTLDFQIYNRWGEQIYRTKDPYFGWDGKFKGTSVNQAVYAFYFELEVEIDGETVLITDVGTIMLLN